MCVCVCVYMCVYIYIYILPRSILGKLRNYLSGVCRLKTGLHTPEKRQQICTRKPPPSYILYAYDQKSYYIVYYVVLLHIYG